MAAAALIALLLLPDVARASGKTWLGRVLAVTSLPALIARRDAARAALAAIGTQARPDPAAYLAARALAQACLDAAPAPALADVEHVGVARGVSIAQVVAECEALRATASQEAELAEAQRGARASELRALLRGDRLKIFDVEGEPTCKCGGGTAREIAKAKEWTYVRGPSGALGTYETLTFVFRGDRLVERRQRRAHERP